MKNSDLILMLINKSINLFGKVLGLSSDAKLEAVQRIIQGAIKSALNTNADLLTSNILADILVKNKFDNDQTNLLINLLCIHAEISLQLNQKQVALIKYKNALQVLHWQTQLPIEKKHLASKNKISELEAIIASVNANAKLH